MWYQHTTPLIINDTLKGSIAMTEPILSESNPVCKAVCPNCHKELNGRYQVKYCSKRCVLDYRIKKGIEKNTKNCPVCNKVFIAKIGHRQDSPGHKNEGRYCSNKCKWIGKRIEKFRKGQRDETL